MVYIVILAGFSLILALLSILATKCYDYRKLCKSLSGLPRAIAPYPLIGHLKFLRRTKDEEDLLVAVGEGIMGMAKLSADTGFYLGWLTVLPFAVLHSADSAGALLSSQTNITKGPQYNLLWPWLKQGLLTSTGRKWKLRRKMLTPTFHYKILSEFQTVFDRCSGMLVEKFEAFAEKDFVDIIPLVTQSMLDVICETALGIKLDRKEKNFNEYEKAVDQMCRIVLKRNVRPWLLNDYIFWLGGSYEIWKKTIHNLHGFTRKILSERKQEMMGNDIHDHTWVEKKRHAFLDLLLQEQLINNSLTDDDICEELDTFCFAGHDTTAMAISWTLYYLGRHPEVQEKIYEEVQSIIGDGNKSITSEDLKRMIYLECVLKESLRLSPPVPLFARYLTEELNIGKYKIPKGITAVIHTYALHRDPKVFPNPEIFDPDRFLPEACVGRSPFAYIPFSAGSRNCIGQRFAMMELKTMISYVVKNFVLESIDPPNEIRYSVALVLRPIDGLRLKIRKRI